MEGIGFGVKTCGVVVGVAVGVMVDGRVYMSVREGLR